MSIMSDYRKTLKKLQGEEATKSQISTSNKKTATNSSFDSFMSDYRSTLKKLQEEDDIAPIADRFTVGSLDDIGPVGSGLTVDSLSDNDIAPLDFFQKGAFADGYQFGDVTKTILGTAGDVGLNAVKGVAGIGEGLGDLINYGIAGVADLAGKEEWADGVRKRTSENFVDKILGGAEDYLDQYSVLGRTSDSALQGLGQVGGIMATGGLGSAAGLGAAGVTALTTGVMGLSGMGSGMGEAYQGGATDEEALKYGTAAGAADAVWELVFGGLGKAVNAVGFSKGLSSLDDIVAKSISKLISSPTGKNITEALVKSGFEGLEELGSGFTQAVAKKLTYMSEEEFGEILKDENLFEQFIVGAVTSSIAQVPSLHIANQSGTDYVTGNTKNEQAVLDKVYQDKIAEAEKDGKVTSKQKKKFYEEAMNELERGEISIDTIEEVLGGETYKAYKDTVTHEDSILEQDKRLREELGKLNEMNPEAMTSEQLARQNEIKSQRKKLESEVNTIKNTSKRTEMQTQIRNEVYQQAKGSRLAESYNQRGQRSKAFEADLTQYDEKQRQTIQKAIDSGILNNTRKTHDFVDWVARTGADKGMVFDFTDNKRLKESGLAIEGKNVNGFVTKDGITLNLNSSKSLNAVVGHEITHVLEGTEFYNELQKAVFDYARAKGELGSRWSNLKELYKDMDADVNAELTADLVGDYLFTDQDFVNRLSTENRNIFEKIFDEIKYLCRVATAGSAEARKLEQVKKMFEDAYRAETKNTVTEDGVKYSLSSIDYPRKMIDYKDTADRRSMEDILVADLINRGKVTTVSQNEIPANINTVNWNDKDEARGCVKEVLKQFLGQDVVFNLGENSAIAYLTTRGIDHAAAGANTKGKAAAFSQFYGLVSNAEYCYSCPADSHSKTSNVGDWDYFVSVANVGKETVPLVFAVRSIDQDVRSQIYNIATKKNPAIPRGDGTQETPANAHPSYEDSPSLEVNVPQAGEDVKGSKLSMSDMDDIAHAGEAIDENTAYTDDIAPIGPNAKMSLSNGETTQYGNYNVMGSDIQIQDDIGPVNTAVNKNAAYTEDIGPVNSAQTAMGNVADFWKGRMDAAVEEGDEEGFWGSLNRYNEAWEDMNSDFAPVSEDVKEAELNRKVEKKIQNIDRRLRQDKEALDEEYRERRADIEASVTRADAKQAELANLDAEYQQEIAELERDAEKARKDAKISVRRKAKQGEYTAEIAALAGDTSTWTDKKMGLGYQTNTLRRNLRDTVRDAEGNRDIAKADALYDYLQGSYNRNEAELNRELNNIRQKYAEMNINEFEDVYIQMLGEFRQNPGTKLTEADVTEYYNQHKAKIDTEKVNKIIEMARKDYDDMFTRVNEALTEQGMRPLEYRKGYFPHFTEPKQGFLARALNWKVKDDSIPTDIAGLTEMFNPTRSWQSFNKQRKTDTTDYSFMKGFDRYSFGAMDWIYHMGDIQKRRAFENYIRYVHSEKGVQERIDKVINSDQYDASDVQDQIDSILKEARNPLNNFVTDLRTGTNTLAGKKSSMDRGVESATNRKFYSTMSNLSNRVNANMVGGSISSALTNFIPITQSWGQVNPAYSLKAMGDTLRSALRDDGTVNKSDFLTNRLNTAEDLHQTKWDKINDKVGWMMDVIDNFTSQTVWRSKYLQNMNEGMSEAEAIKNADQFAENVMAGRSRGNMPTIFDSKNPIIKMVTAFQLEVNNQYGYMLKDMPQDMANESKAKLVAGYAKMFIGAYAYNALYSMLTGRDAAFDPIGIIEELFRDLFDDDDEEDNLLDAGLNLFDNVLDELPFISGLTGGGRIPISSAMPYDGLYEMITGTATDIAEKDWESLTSEWLNPVYYLLAPVGGGQVRKTVQGLSMFNVNEDHPVAGSYTPSGSLRFDVEDTLWNRVQAGLFGQWANENAQEYIDEGYSPLSESQVDQMMELGVTAKEYRTYMAGISEAGKTTDENGYQKYVSATGKVYWYDKDNLTLYNSDYTENKVVSVLNLEKASSTEQKVEYISNLPITTDQKNILYKDVVNQSLTDQYGYAKYTGTQINEDGEEEEGNFFYDSKRNVWYDDDYAPIAKSDIDDLAPIKEWDMSDYDEYDDYEEFDFAIKNEEKYQFLQDCGVSFKEYSKDENTKEAYDWAYSNPDLYTFSKAVNEDLVEYRKQYSAMNAIKADYDSNGKAISGSRKNKIIQYVNSLPLGIVEKAMLIRTEYTSFDYYNDEIFNHVNGMDMTFAEKKTILEYLGAKVDSNGYVTWD